MHRKLLFVRTGVSYLFDISQELLRFPGLPSEHCAWASMPWPATELGLGQHEEGDIGHLHQAQDDHGRRFPSGLPLLHLPEAQVNTSLKGR